MLVALLNWKKFTTAHDFAGPTRPGFGELRIKQVTAN